MSASPYPRLFSEWQLRNTTIKNRVVFPPTCPTWVDDPWSGLFTEMAVDYYEERAKGGVGLIIIGSAHVHPSSLMAPLLMPNLHDDRQIERLQKIADAVHRHGCKLAIQLWHSGVRGFPTYKQAPDHDIDATWHTLSPSQVPLGEFPGSSTPKEMDEAEIEEILAAYGSAAKRAIDGGLDGVELHLGHGYLPWQFLSPLYNKRSDGWGGSYEKRMRFPIEALQRMRASIGDDPFVGFRINSTSFWPGDLEIDDVKSIVGDVQRQTDTDYVNVTAGVHHAFIHTPMWYEPGWERGYARAIREVSETPVLLVGRITTPEVAEELLEAGDGDAICLARQLFADPEWANKAAEGRSEDIRRCVAANYCWRSAATGRRVQCIYNPEMGREGTWGSGTLVPVGSPRRVLVIGGGPAGLEYARVASARGHAVTVLEGNAATGGHVRVQSLLPSRSEYGQIATWLAAQARKNGAEIRTATRVDAAGIEALVAAERPDHVVVATGSTACRDGFQGWTGDALPGWERARCVAWDEVAEGTVEPSGKVVVLDDLCDVIAPLTAVGLAGKGCEVSLVTRWPMVGMETILDVYLDWLLPSLYEAKVEIVVDHFVEEITPTSVRIFNVHHEQSKRELPADWLVLATARQSVNELAAPLERSGISFEVIGDAIAPRGTYEAVFEGHRAGRKL